MLSEREVEIKTHLSTIDTHKSTISVLNDKVAGQE